MKRALVLGGGAAGWLVATAAPAFAQADGAGAENNLFILLGALGAGLALALFIFLVFGPNRAVERDLSGRLGTYANQPQQQQGRFKNPLLRRFVTRAESVAERRGLFGQIETAMEQANLPLRPGEAIAITIGIAVVVGSLAGLYYRNLIAALVGFGLTLLAGAAAVNFVASRERTKFESQLPDTLNLISTSLRAGYSLLQALEAVASEAPEPTRREFGRALNETRLGRSPVDALKDVGERMESVDFDWAVLAISIQREVGGNLAEVLQTAAETMLHRNRLRREMKALTAEGRISAMVLGGLPFFLFAFFWTTNREYLEPLFESVWGIGSVLFALGLLLVGIFWLTRIVKIEI
jgi:tight adherence protein B